MLKRVQHDEGGVSDAPTPLVDQSFISTDLVSR